MSVTTSQFRNNLNELVQKCELEMRREGWHEPGFDEDHFTQLPSYVTCRDIDTLIIESYGIVSRQAIVEDFEQRRDVAVESLSHLKIRQVEALLWDVHPDVALRYKLNRRIPATIGYIGVRPLLDEKTDLLERPYAGPFIVGSIMAGFSYRKQSSVTTQSVANQFGFVQLRGASFSTLYLEPALTQPVLN